MDETPLNQPGCICAAASVWRWPSQSVPQTYICLIEIFSILFAKDFLFVDANVDIEKICLRQVVRMFVGVHPDEGR